MNGIFLRACVVAGAAVVVGSSCSTVKIDSWTAPDMSGRPMGKTIVVGVSNTEAIRRDYEEQFAESLLASGVDAVASYTVVQKEEKLSKEEFVAMLGQQDFDSVIVTRVIGKEDRLRYHPPITYPRPYYSHYGYYNLSYSRAHSPGYMEDYVQTLLETNLYDVESTDLVWSGQKQVTSETPTKKNIQNVIKAVVKDLNRQGLIDGPAS